MTGSALNLIEYLHGHDPLGVLMDLSQRTQQLAAVMADYSRTQEAAGEESIPSHRDRKCVPMNYRNLDLELSAYLAENGTEHYSVRVLYSPAGEQGTGEADAVTLPADLRARLRTLERGKLGLTEMIALGKELGDGLFPQRARWFLDQSRAMLRDAEGLRIRLRLETYSLANLPWEYAYIPRLDTPPGQESADGFLVLNSRISLVRYEVLGQSPGTLAPVGAGPLRMVVFLANPGVPGFNKLDLDRELGNIQETLREMSDVRVDSHTHTTRQILLDSLQGGNAHLFHFAGHGEFKGDMGRLYGTVEGDGYLVLEGDREADYFSAEALALLLRHRGVRLAVLGACETGRRDGVNAWTGIVPALTRAGIPAVVGNQYQIKDKNAIRFSRSFYRALANGESIDAAVTNGRQAISTLSGLDDRDWGVAVLHLRTDEGVLFPKPPSVAPAEGPDRSTQSEPVAPAPDITTGGIMRTNVPLLPDELWIDRPQLISELERLLQSGTRLLLIDTVAPHGNGKTTLLSQLYWHLDANDTFEPLWLSIDRFRLAQPDHEPELTVEDEYLMFRDILYNILDSMAQSLELEGSFLAGFANRCTELQERVSTLGEVNTLRTQVADEFIARAIDITRKRPCVLLVDEFGCIIGKQTGKWFVDLLGRLDSISVVLARSVTPDPFKRRSFVRDFTVGPFSVSEVHTYLRKRFGDRPGLERLSACIHGFSNGHPGTVALAADTIHKDELGDMEGLIDSFDRIRRELLPDDQRATILEQKYDRMIEEVLRDIREKDAELEPVLYAAAVLRSYTRDVMEGVLTEREEDTKQQSRSPNDSTPTDRLCDYSFVDELAHRKNKEDKLAHKKNEESVYTVQNLVRKHLVNRLREKDPGLYAEIHERARDYYLGQMSNLKEKEAKKVYEGNYRLEKQEWQEYCIEWLYHVSAGDDRAAARLHFAREYFESFNWWNWFLPFEYSAQLLELWQQVAREEKDVKLLEDLCKLDASYPKGYDKHGYKQEWIAARKSLMNLKRVLGLGAQVANLSSDARTILGFIEWFIAQSYQFGAPQRFDWAEEYFENSRKAWEAEEDRWNLIWTDSYMADLYMEMGLRDKAVEKAEASLQEATSGEMEAKDDLDLEVISQNYRVLGDVYWSAGELGPAFREYARAVFHAYVFNAIPNDADEYTTTLYSSVCRHVSGRLLRLVNAKGQSVAHQAAEYLLDFWGPYRQYSGIVSDRSRLSSTLDMEEEQALDALASLLFPPVPQGREDCELIGLLHKEMRKDVEKLEPAPIAQSG